MAVRRLGVPDDIAAAVAYMTSEDAGYLTGQVLCVDGGLTMC
jgi:3-oxoacyl-[acyl-carrier protein] reductase